MSESVSGFFGKLPARGDFVERRLSRAFVERWDGWLQRAIAASKNELADDWLDTYLTSPVWTFASSAGVFGPAACVGVYMPSVDKVGRYYPMTIALELPEERTPWSILNAAGLWAAEAEQVLFSLLGEDFVDLDVFDAAVAALTLPLDAVVELPISGTSEEFSGPLQCQIADANALPLLGAELADVFTGNELPPHTLWCTPGSELVAPSLLVVEGMPDEAAYSSLLDGQWQQRGWHTRDFTDVAALGEGLEGLAEIKVDEGLLTGDILDVQDATAGTGLDIGLEAVELGVEPGSLGIEELGIVANEAPAAVLSELDSTAEHPIVALADHHGLPDESLPVTRIDGTAEAYFANSGAVTHKGNVRKSNQDACDGSDRLGLWMVADGVGGHGAGELASALAVRVIRELPMHGSLEQQAATLQGGLRLVEQSLLAIGRRYGDADRSATTVVALIQEADQVLLAWAGDSRIYRIRDRVLTQLTDDHSAPEIEGVDQSNVITRAVGGEDPVEIELRYETLVTGDRFLLCSDGVYRELDDEELLTLGSLAGPQECCDAMQERILTTPAKDNFTALLVEFSA